MKIYNIQKKETGTVLEYAYAKETAEEIVELYEAHDKAEDIYEEGLYEVKEAEVEDDGKDGIERDAWDAATIRIIRENF